jgi:hypothetical protein
LLGFTVHQHIEAKLLLFAHGVLDLFVHGGCVRRDVELSGAEIAARLADLGSLRERADGCSRKLGQLECAALQLGAHGKRGLALRFHR